MHIGHCRKQNINRGQFIAPLGIVAGLSTLGFCGTAYNVFAVTDVTDTTDVTVTCNIATTISIAASSNSLNIASDPSGTQNLAPGIFGLANATIRVATNNPYGYTLSMGMSESSTNNQLNLASPSASIPSISSSTVGSKFSNDTGGWGYMIGNGTAASTYLPIPAKGITDTLKVASVARVDDDTPVTIGVKPSSSSPKGIYSNIVTFTAAINNAPVPKTLGYIAITNNPNKTSYTAGENFDPTDMVITAYYSDGTSAIINAGSGGYTIIGGTNLAAGTTYVTISYTYTNGGISTTRTINVPITVTSAANSGGTSNAPARSTSPLLSANRNALSGDSSESIESSESTSSNDSTDGKAEAQGVRDAVTGSGMDAALAVALGATAVTAASGLFFIILLAKRDDEDDDEEESATN